MHEGTIAPYPERRVLPETERDGARSGGSRTHERARGPCLAKCNPLQ